MTTAALDRYLNEVEPKLVPTKPHSQYSDEHDLIPTSSGRLDKEQVDALRRGDLATAFESPFDRLTIEDPSHLQPTGGTGGAPTRTAS